MFFDTCPMHIKSWYENANNEDRMKALSIGHYIVSNSLHKVCEEEIECLKQEYNTKATSLHDEYTNSLDMLKQQRGNDLDTYNHKLLSITETYLQKNTDFMKEQLNNYKQDEIALLKSEITSLNTKLSVVQSTNFYKGEEGENLVKAILHANFISYEIKDASSQSKTADIHLIAPSNKFVAIECKNKQTITATDVKKSLDDIKNLKQNDSFIGYFFVSIKSNNIPKKGSLFYEIIDDIPVIWYATNNTSYLEHDVINLVKMLFMHTNKQPVNDIHTCLNEYFSRVQELKKLADDSLKSVASLKSNITNMKSSIDYIYDDIFKMLKT